MLQGQCKSVSDLSARELADIKVQLAKAAKTQADRRSNLRKVLDELAPEIIQLREAGYSWPGVVQQLARQGVGVNEITLRHYVDGPKSKPARKASSPSPAPLAP